LRILLGNIADFDAAKDSVPRSQWTDLDLYINERFGALITKCADFYASYQFSQVYQAVNRFCAVDLSAFYIDVLKDRMYCSAKEDLRRRSAQSAMHEIVSGLARILAPVIPFTAEEAWSFLGRKNSVHLEKFPSAGEFPSNPNLQQNGEALLELRGKVNEKLEVARREKLIGKSLEAYITIPEIRGLAGPLNFDLDEVFVASQVWVDDPKAEITVTRAEDHGMKKCVRCWKYWDRVGSDPAHPELCDRCTGVVLNWQL
jgi:isoleucyl-tRNA synthetase